MLDIRTLLLSCWHGSQTPYAVEKFSCRIHAFCLMTNYFHLIMQVGDIPLARIMQNISLRYLVCKEG
jgi:hypothetical protein